MTVANTTIQLKKSLVSGNVPVSLTDGELAINSADDKLFYSKPGGSIAYITNQQSFATINANSSLVLAGSSTDTLTLVPGSNMTITACTATKTITFTSSEPLDQFARDTANSASSNTVHTQGVDSAQNTRISTVEANTIYLFGALNQTNTNIVNANTQLKSYVDGEINAVLNYSNGIDNQQNTRISTVESNTVYLFGALNQTNTNIVNANTQLKSYVDGQVSYISGINNTQNTNITTTTNLAQGAYDTANLKFNTSGGNITGPVTISSNLTITGNLTVAGNVTTVSANNLVLQDNMIYLNSGNKVANPDLGIAGNYNDGTYHHAGFFRDSSDGIWKVYDQYLPEPDASPYIDTSNSSFRIADFQANNVTLGKITTSSSQLVLNLNADYLDGQHGSYYATASEQSGINATQNTNITIATNLSQGAYDKANGLVQTGFVSISTNGSSISATSNNDTLTLVAGNNITITACTASKTITFTSGTEGSIFLQNTSTNQTINYFDKNQYMTAKYLIQAVYGDSIHSTELIVSHDNFGAYVTEYGTIINYDFLVDFSTSISSNNVQLQVTPTYSNTTIDFTRTSLTSRPIVGIVGDLMPQSGIIDLQNQYGYFDLNI
jgi:hypothetical protein